MAFINNNCACPCGTLCGGTCNLFPASAFQKYLDNEQNLPPEIYFCGTRQFNDSQYVSALAGGPPKDVKTWGGVTGGTLVSRSGLGYGNTTDGVILEPLDPEFPSAGYTWAVYKDGQRSVADYLIDGTTRHDNFASTYAVSLQNGFYDPRFLTLPLPSSYTITRVSCGTWKQLQYLPDMQLGCDLKPAWLVFPSDSNDITFLQQNRIFEIETNGFGLPNDADDGPSALRRGAGGMYYTSINRQGPGVWVPESSFTGDDGNTYTTPGYCNGGGGNCECGQDYYKILFTLPYFPGYNIKPAPTNYVGNGIAGEWGDWFEGEYYYNEEGEYYEWIPYDQPIFKNAYIIQ
jgi:hypothetical protein